MLEVVSFYKYLGIMFSSKLQWTLTQKTLASQGLKAMFNINKLSHLSGGLLPSAQLDMFSKMIIPIITYEAKIWGSRVERCIENVQVKFCGAQIGLGGIILALKLLQNF